MGDRLKDKVALVSGAGSSGPGWGNGKATAALFAREGAKILATDINLDAALETKRIIDASGSICEAIARASGEMPRRIFATQLLDKLPQQLAPQSVPRTSDRPGFFDTPVESRVSFRKPATSALQRRSLRSVAGPTIGAILAKLA